MKTSDSFEMIADVSNPQFSHLITNGQTSKLHNQNTAKGFRGARDSQDSNQRSQVLIGEKKAMTAAKDAPSILTNYQQKTLQ